MSQFSTNQTKKQDGNETLHVGIDLALEKNVCVVTRENGEKLDHFNFLQSRCGYDYFLKRVRIISQKQSTSRLVVAMEPSNYFWKLMARELEENGITYHLVNAYTVKKHREGNQLDRSKDDRRDAVQIAELSRNGHYTETKLQKGIYEEIKQYAVAYHQLSRSIRREQHILWGLVGQVFPEYFQIFKNLNGETSRAILISNACAAEIRKMKEDDFLAEVKAAYLGKRQSVTKVQQVYQLAATSIGILEGLQAVQLSIQIHLSNIQRFQMQLNQVTDAMTNCLASLPEAEYLLSVKSLGEVSIALFLAEIGDPKRYKCASQWVKLAGIQPTPNSSGKKQHGRTPISRQGRPHLRTMLYFSCLRMIQYDSHFALLYSKLQRRSKNPLTKMQALGVLMNKLLHILWALIHQHTMYNPAFAQSLLVIDHQGTP
jgi:transposase